MDGAVLAHLELGEVEAEGLHHPDQVLQLAVGAPLVARLDQALLDQPKVGEHLLGVAVGQPGVLGLGGGDPRADGQQLLPVRLGGGVLDDLGHLLGHRDRVVGQSREQRGGRRAGVPVHRHRAGHPVDVEGEQGQRLVGLGGQRLPGHLAGDERVAVAVPADPAAEPHERRYVVRIAALPGGAAPGERRLDGAIEPWDGTEQRLVEDRQRRLDLVGRLRTGPAEGGGALQDVDVLQQPATGDLALRGAVGRVVVAVQLGGDPAQRRRDRAAAGLGRVRREHRVDAQPVELGLDGVPGRGDGRPDVAGVEVSGELGVLGPQRPGPVSLVGEVGQVEVHRDGAGEPGGRACVDVPVVRGRGLPRRAHQGVDELDESGVLGLAQDLGVQLPEQGEVALERGRHGGSLVR